MKCRSSPIGRFRHCMKIGDEGRKWSGKTKGTFQSRCCERRTLDKYRRCGSPPPPYDVPPAIYRINTSHLRTQAHSAFERHGREGRMRVFRLGLSLAAVIAMSGILQAATDRKSTRLNSSH